MRIQRLRRIVFRSCLLATAASVGCSATPYRTWDGDTPAPLRPSSPQKPENPAVAEWRSLIERSKSRTNDEASSSATFVLAGTERDTSSGRPTSVDSASVRTVAFDATERSAAEESTAETPARLPIAPPPPEASASSIGGSTTPGVSPAEAGLSAPLRNVPLAGAGAAPVAIDLPSVLEMATGQNPEVGFARQRINEAYARVRRADVLWLPSIRAGANWNHHDGRIQDVRGELIETSRSSFYGGLGAQAVGAGSPAVPGISVNVAVRDAVFQPRIAEQTMGARRFESRAVSNDVLMNAAVAYVDLLEALQTEAVAQETLVNAERLAELTQNFAEVGQGLRSDADRADAELASRRIEARRASEASRVAATRLARVLSVDPTIPLAPVEPTLVPLDLTPPATSPQELVSIGLTNRPELAQNRYLVGEAVEILRREQYAPLLPSVLLGASYGGNSGGLGSDLDNFGDRVDLDAAAFWEIRNLGAGERWAQNEANARVEQAKWRQIQLMDQVASEVVEAHAQVSERVEQVSLAQSGIEAARSSYDRNVDRIQEAQGLPIETLQAIQALDAAQRQYVRAIADYNRAQFRLHRAIGWPVDAI